MSALPPPTPQPPLRRPGSFPSSFSFFGPTRPAIPNFQMPRRFFRFPSKDRVDSSPSQPPPPPPKPETKGISAPSPLSNMDRSRRVTGPPVAHIRLGPPKTPATRLPHRASASDSFAQGTAWRVPATPATSDAVPTGKETDAPPRVAPNAGAEVPRPLRRSKGHRPIAEERERRTKAETLLKEQSKLKKEIDEETARLTQIQQRQEALRYERERVENARKEKERLSREPVEDANLYGRSQSTPMLHEFTPYPRGRSTAQSQESFRSTSSHEPEYRRVWSRTPSVSSNDRSSPPGLNWKKVEQARREREKALLKMSEARALEKKTFEEAWSIYESRWMLLTFATRSIGPSSNTEVQQTNAASHLTLSFSDIPWPLLYLPRTCHDITAESIKRFLASEYHSSEKTHRERIKEALLRWHPDRFGSRILDHVRESQRDEVRKGVDIVVRCLNELLSKV